MSVSLLVLQISQLVITFDGCSPPGTVTHVSEKYSQTGTVSEQVCKPTDSGPLLTLSSNIATPYSVKDQLPFSGRSCMNGYWSRDIPRCLSSDKQVNAKRFDPKGATTIRPGDKVFKYVSGEGILSIELDRKSLVSAVIVTCNERNELILESNRHERSDGQWYDNLDMPLKLSNGSRKCRLSTKDDYFDPTIMKNFKSHNLLGYDLNQSDFYDRILFICETPDIGHQSTTNNLHDYLSSYYTDTVTIKFGKRIVHTIFGVQLLRPDPFDCTNSRPDSPLDGYNDLTRYETEDTRLRQEISNFYYHIHKKQPQGVLVRKNAVSCRPNFELIYEMSNGSLLVETNPIHICGPEGAFIGRRYKCRPTFECLFFDEELLLNNSVTVNYTNGYTFNSTFMAIEDGNRSTSAKFSCLFENQTKSFDFPLLCSNRKSDFHGWSGTIPYCFFTNQTVAPLEDPLLTKSNEVLIHVGYGLAALFLTTTVVTGMVLCVFKRNTNQLKYEVKFLQGLRDQCNQCNRWQGNTLMQSQSLSKIRIRNRRNTSNVTLPPPSDPRPDLHQIQLPPITFKSSNVGVTYKNHKDTNDDIYDNPATMFIN